MTNSMWNAGVRMPWYGCWSHRPIRSHQMSWVKDTPYLIAPEKRVFALNLLDRWLDSLSLSKGLDEAILEADRIAGLGNDMGKATIKHGPFLSHAAERAIFAHTCTSLSQQSGRELLEALASLNDDVHRHAQGFWNYKDSQSHPQSIPWGELARLGTAVQMLLDASPLRDWANPGEAHRLVYKERVACR